MAALLLSFVGCGIIFYFYRLYIQGQQYTKDTKINGKVVIITGSNTGIGKVTAIDLAKRGAKVYIACRSVQRGEQALKEIIKESKSPLVELLLLDLSSMKSIHKFAEEFLKKETRLDILINNAGVMACPRQLTEDGYEMQIGTNHMGHFLLTNLLLDLIKKSAPARIINVSSMAQKYGKINKDDLNSEHSYHPVTVYCQSKLANVCFTRELAKRLEGTGVSVYSLHPGVINTELGRHLGDSMSKILNHTVRTVIQTVFYKTPEAGAQTTIYCAVDPDLEKVSGEYFAECAVAEMNPLALDDELCRWLWTESERWTKLKPEQELNFN